MANRTSREELFTLMIPRRNRKIDTVVGDFDRSPKLSGNKL